MISRYNQIKDRNQLRPDKIKMILLTFAHVLIYHLQEVDHQSKLNNAKSSLSTPIQSSICLYKWIATEVSTAAIMKNLS